MWWTDDTGRIGEDAYVLCSQCSSEGEFFLLGSLGLFSHSHDIMVLKFLPFSCVNVGAFVYKSTLSLKSEAYTKYFPFLLFYRVRGWIRLAPSTEVCDVFHKNDKLVKMT